MSDLPTRLQRRFRGGSQNNLIYEGYLTPTTNIPSLAYIDLDDGTTESYELVERRTEGDIEVLTFDFRNRLPRSEADAKVAEGYTSKEWEFQGKMLLRKRDTE